MQKCGGERFIRNLDKGDLMGARLEIERLLHETARSLEPVGSPLWGMVDKMPDHTLRSAVGIILEFLGLRSRKWPSVGAIEQIERILAEEKFLGKRILLEKERLRARRLLMTYTLRHPRYPRGTLPALNALIGHFQQKKIYRKTLSTYSRSRIFAPSVRENLIKHGLSKRPKRLFRGI